MKKYLIMSTLFICGSEILSIAVLTIMVVFALCDFARVADKKGV